MLIDLEQTAREDLAQWGLAMRPEYIPGYAKTPSSEVKLDVLGNPLTITEDYAVYLDSVISGLKLYDEVSHLAAKLYFVNSLNYRQVGIKCGVNKNKVGALLDSAVSWVARGIYDKKIKKVA